MSEGTVIEQGTHFELLRKVNGTYAKLIASQDLGEMQTSPNDEVDVIEPTDLEETKKESDQKMLDDEAIESASMVQHEPNASIKRSDQEEGGEILAIIDKSVSRGLVSGMLRILSEEKQLRVPVIATITAACLAGMIISPPSALATICSTGRASLQQCLLEYSGFITNMSNLISRNISRTSCPLCKNAGCIPEQRSAPRQLICAVVLHTCRWQLSCLCPGLLGSQYSSSGETRLVCLAVMQDSWPPVMQGGDLY